MSNPRILFVGGCHVIGYPVGREYAFPLVAAHELESAGANCEIQCVPHVPLHHPERLEDAYRKFQPNIVVLQVGNYELGNELLPFLLRRVGVRRRRKKQVSSAWVVKTVNVGRFNLRARVKQAIDKVLRHPLLEIREFEAKLNRFMIATADCEPKCVVVMSSTPCSDPTAMYYRFVGARALEKAACEHNWIYLDILRLKPEPEEHWLGREMFFADAIHLGIAGQAAVGRLLARQLQRFVC